MTALRGYIQGQNAGVGTSLAWRNSKGASSWV